MATDGSIGAVAAPGGNRADAMRQVLLHLAILTVALLPVVLNPLGIAGDYPNHLARVYIEQNLASSAALQQHYTLDWGIYPHLGMDLMIGPLMPFIGPYAAGATFNVLALAMLPIGIMLLSLVVTGRVGLLPSASVLLIYGAPAAWGFVNFLFATGLAMILFAGWIYARPGWRRVAIFAPLILVLFFIHMLGFLLFCFLVLAYETGRFLAGERGTLRRFAFGLLLRDALVTVLPLVLFAASFEARAEEIPTGHNEFGALSDRITALLAPFHHHGGTETVALFVGFYGLLCIAFGCRLLVLAPAMRPVFLAAVILVLAVPMTFMGIQLLHLRFGALPGAVLLGSSVVTPDGRRYLGPLFLGFGLLFALQQGTVHAEMAALDQQQREMRAALAGLPKGSRVLIGASAESVQVMHTPSLVIIEKDGYVPGLFTHTSPVGVSSAVAPIHRPPMQPLTAEQLLEGQRHPPPRASGPRRGTYFHGWPRTFDALVWLTPDGVPAPASPHLTEIARGEGFMLYQVSPGFRPGRP